MKKSKYCLIFQMFLLFWGPLARPFCIIWHIRFNQNIKNKIQNHLKFCFFSWNQLIILKSCLEIKNQKLRFASFQRKKNYLLSEELQWTFLCIIAKIQKKFQMQIQFSKILLLSKKCIIQIFSLFSVKPSAANPSHVPVSIRLVLLSREGWVYCCDFFTCHSSWLPNPFLPYRVSETKKWHFKSKNWVWYTLYFLVTIQNQM